MWGHSKSEIFNFWNFSISFCLKMVCTSCISKFQKLLSPVNNILMNLLPPKDIHTKRTSFTNHKTASPLMTLDEFSLAWRGKMRRGKMMREKKTGKLLGSLKCLLRNFGFPQLIRTAAGEIPSLPISTGRGPPEASRSKRLAKANLGHRIKQLAVFWTFL